MVAKNSGCDAGYLHSWRLGAAWRAWFMGGVTQLDYPLLLTPHLSESYRGPVSERAARRTAELLVINPSSTTIPLLAPFPLPPPSLPRPPSLTPRLGNSYAF